MASYMFYAISLPRNIWVEELNYDNYIQNISPHRSIKDQTPFEALTNNKLEFTQFCVFDSDAWAWIPSEERKSLDPHSTACIFFGYLDGLNGYIFIDPSIDQLIIEHNVQFEESILHAPREPHANIFFLSLVRDDEFSHSESTSNMSFYTDSEDLEHVDA